MAGGAGKRINEDLDRDMITCHIYKCTVYAYHSSEYVKYMGTPKRLREVEEEIDGGSEDIQIINDL